MAFVDDGEIIATIRHEIRIEDEGGGKCSEVIPAVNRRAKYNGLPLDFRTAKEDDDDEDTPSPGYTIVLEEEATSTADILSTRMRARTADSNSRSHVDVSKTLNTIPSNELFIEVDLADLQLPTTSSTSRYLSSNTISEVDQSIREYSRFEANEGSPSKSIQIIFALEDEENLSMKIRVKLNARISEVIGLCAFKYLQRTGHTIASSPHDLQLFIAEETGEIDEDFPPLDSHQVIGDLGFTTLAIQRRKSKSSSGSTVIVYLPTEHKKRFVFDLPHLQQTIRWLRDEAVERRIALMEEHEKAAFRRVGEYNLEHVDIPDQPLELDVSIASTGTTEFVLVRMNSSRELFHPRDIFDSVPSTPTTSNSLPRNFADPLRPSSLPSEDGLVAEFRVERLHKYKPKWAARLSIRWNHIEVSPWNMERRLSNVLSTQKKIQLIAWEDVCSVRSSEKKNPGGGLPFIYVHITWLPSHSVAGTPVLLSYDQAVRDIAQRSKEENWKVLNLEAENQSDAQQILSLISSAIKQRNSPAAQVFAHSLNGAVRPGPSAEAALANQRELSSPLLPATHHRKRSSIFGNIGAIQRFLNKEE